MAADVHRSPIVNIDKQVTDERLKQVHHHGALRCLADRVVAGSESEGGIEEAEARLRKRKREREQKMLVWEGAGLSLESCVFCCATCSSFGSVAII